MDLRFLMTFFFAVPKGFFRIFFNNFFNDFLIKLFFGTSTLIVFFFINLFDFQECEAINHVIISLKTARLT